jgi:DNA-binding transcriptional LysR family regulator
LREHGKPRRPADLSRHRALVFAEPRPWNSIELERGRKRVRVELTPVVTSNNGDVLRELAIAGLGIIPSPILILRDAVSEGRLESVLPDWHVVPRPKLWAIYPHRRFVPAKVRLVVDALRAGLA